MKEENFQNYEHEYLFTHAKICSLSRATTLKARIYIKKKKQIKLHIPSVSVHKQILASKPFSFLDDDEEKEKWLAHYL